MTGNNESEKEFINRIETDDKKEILEYKDEMSIHYIYSVGELSKFFLEIRDHEKLLGTRCTKCGFGFFPPRLNCHKCYAPCEWVELSGKGEVIAGTICRFGVSNFTDSLPIIIAFIKMDEMDMSIRHTIVMDAEETTLEDIKKGTRVKVHFRPRDQREGKITDFYFVLDK